MAAFWQLYKKNGGPYLAQEQAFSTDALRTHIYSLPCTPKCRMCGSSDENADHLVSWCPLLAQSAYKQRHDKVAGLLHWQLSTMAGIMYGMSWLVASFNW